MGADLSTGQSVLVLVNGRVVGRMTSFDLNRRTSLRRAQGVDQLYSSELIRGPVIVAGKLGMVKVRRDGGAVGAGLMVPDPDLSQEQYVTLTLKDRRSGTIIFQVNDCLVDSEGWTVQVKNIMTASVSFEGLRVVGEVNSARR